MKRFFARIKNALPESRKTRIILGALVGLGIIGAVVLGSFTNNFVAGMSILNLPGVPVLSENAQNAAQTPGAEGTPVAATLQPILETQEAWDGKSRVNLLIMGLDARDLEATAPRTDSMILFTMDPVNLTAGMISIPRDLWVEIPTSGYGRINTAHYLGDLYDYPGGGPALAALTVERNLGIHIDYYVRINFEAFVTFVDEIGGIDIEVPETIDDPLYPDNNYGYEPLYIEAGLQHFYGDMALKYARTRHSGNGDFDRARRQLLQIQPDHPGVELLGGGQVADLQMDVSDARLRIDARPWFQLALQFENQLVKVERRGDHAQLTIWLARPLLPRTVAVELDPVSLRISQVERLADAVVRRPLQWITRVEQPPQGRTQAGTIGHEDRKVI